MKFIIYAILKQRARAENLSADPLGYRLVDPQLLQCYGEIHDQVVNLTILNRADKKRKKNETVKHFQRNVGTPVL